MKEISEYENILVYRTGHLGDTIVALPAFWEIRDHFPGARMTLLTNADQKNKNYIMAKSVLPDQGLFDSILSYDNSAGKLEKLKNFGRLLINLKKQKYDCVFYLSTRIRELAQIERDIKFFRLAGIKKVFGAEHLKKKLLSFDQLRPLPEVSREYEFLLDCLPFNIENYYSKTLNVLRLSDSEKKNAVEWLTVNCGEAYSNKQIIAVAPGSKWDSKKWFENSFITVLKKLIKNYDVFPIIFGGQEDIQIGDRIISATTRGKNAAGLLNIRDGAAVLEHCRIYLGNDTGTMHMASAVGIPCVGLFAAIDFKGRWYPFGSDNKIFRNTVECEGCHTPNCYNDRKCLKLISISEVIKACENILKR